MRGTAQAATTRARRLQAQAAPSRPARRHWQLGSPATRRIHVGGRAAPWLDGWRLSLLSVYRYAVGFEPMHGYLVNQRQDLALLWLGKSALEALRTNAAYQSSKEDAQARHQMPRDATQCQTMPRDATRCSSPSPSSRLQPHPPKAATPPTQGCKPIHPRLQPRPPKAASPFTQGCKPTQVRHAMQLSKMEFEVSTETQRAAFLSRVGEEPKEGEAGTAKICFHVGQTQARRPPLSEGPAGGSAEGIAANSLGGAWGGSGTGAQCGAIGAHTRRTPPADVATVRVVQHAGGAAALRAQPAVHAARQAAPGQRDDVAPRDTRPAVTARTDPAAPRPLACRTHPCPSRVSI